MESPRAAGAFSVYSERDLQDLWEQRRFRQDGLLTEDAVPIAVEFPGFRWGEGGPDFRGARLRFGGRPVWGDVELHLTPSGWAAHGHRRDGAYASVVLHVVLRRDRFAEPPKDPPLLVLEPYLHGTLPPAPPAGSEDLDALGEEWFAERRGRMERALERDSADEVLYREILVGLGYKHNKAAMAELGRQRPLASLPAGGAAEIEAALASAARRLPRGLWRLRNVRPANHPWRRLEGAARFLAAERGAGLAAGLAGRPGLPAMTAWLAHDGIGVARALEISVNVFLPFLGGEAWRAAADGPAPAALPGLLRRPEAAGATTLRRYFGALRAMKRRA